MMAPRNNNNDLFGVIATILLAIILCPILFASRRYQRFTQSREDRKWWISIYIGFGVIFVFLMIAILNSLVRHEG
jgi:threonine/homoserine/homoserine lactone efflux protein